MRRRYACNAAQQQEARVDELVAKLGLSDVANSIIGKEGRRGISGGERKRVGVGVELVTGPAVRYTAN